MAVNLGTFFPTPDAGLIPFLQLSPNQMGTPSGTVRLATGQLVIGPRHKFAKAAAVSAKFSGNGSGIDLKGIGETIGRELLDRLLDRFRSGGGGGGGGTGGGGGDVQIPFTGAGCPSGQVEILGKCVDPGAFLPGGDPFVTKAGGQPVTGAFGFPAQTPDVRSRETRSCGPRMVLGFDNLCYPKAVLPPRSRFRKWRRAPKPIISRRDTVALRIAGRARDRLADAAKDAGLFVSKTARKSAPRARASHGHGAVLKVISEETN